MSSEPRPLHVVVVSPDTTLLHEVSWILEAVGYKVQTTKDFDPDGLWRRYSVTDIVIVDGRHSGEPTAAAFAHESDNPIYRIFLYDPAKPTDFAAWYAAGAHDALHTPVSRGELLARVRTGARYLEFERRLAYQSSRCNVPGMYSRRGFLRKLRKLAAGEDFGSLQHTLLMTSIDWYAGIRRKCGETVSRGLVSAAARAIKRAVGDGAVSAYFGDGRFATLLTGHTLAAAKSAAECAGQGLCQPREPSRIDSAADADQRDHTVVGRHDRRAVRQRGVGIARFGRALGRRLCDSTGRFPEGAFRLAK